MHFDCLLICLEKGFKFVGLTKTWLSSHDVDPYTFSGYEVEASCRNRGYSGDASSLISEEVSYTRRVDF